MKGRILIADDEALIRQVLADTLKNEGYQVEAVGSGLSALRALQERPFDLAFVDIRMPEISGLDLLLKVQEAGIDTPFIIMTVHTTLANAVEAMKRGAYDYLTKPFDLTEVQTLTRRALEVRQLTRDLERLKQEIRSRHELIVGKSPAMQEIYKLIGRVAKSDATVLIQGESGTGKELIAKVIHYHSPRWRAPFVPLNCSAIPHELLESELFGYEKGAFTGAFERRIGRFEQAEGGTLFLDEVGDMPLELQAKLLRVLQEKELSRVGGREMLKVDVRIVAATNQDLELAVKEKRFREDLYFRLKVVPITVPPLRQRKSDIPELVDYFIDKINREMGTRVAGVSPEALEQLLAYPWPGNVRELENTLLRAAILAPGRTLTPAELALPGWEPPEAEETPSWKKMLRKKLEANFQLHLQTQPSTLYDTVMRQVEKILLELALEKTQGNQLKAAKILGLNRNTLRKKMALLGLGSLKE